MSLDDPVEALRLDAVSRMESHDYSGALDLLSKAAARCSDDTAAERLTLNTATALILLRDDGPAIRELPEILIRRRSPLHAALAAYNLQLKHLLAADHERALKYGRIALREAMSTGRTSMYAPILIDLGAVAMCLSRFGEAVGYLRRAHARIHPENRQHRAVTLENMGYCYLQLGQPARAVRFIGKALGVFEQAGPEEYRCETLLDLCQAHLASGDPELARKAGRECLAIADEPRQVRNCHYLLGEAALRLGKEREAKRHFEVLAAFYPGFRGLTDLLLALDLNGMVNLKL